MVSRLESAGVGELTAWDHCLMAAIATPLTAAIERDQIGPGSVWFPWPDGWRGEISTALIDAIYSARATYTTKRGRGIHALVSSWSKGHTIQQRDSLIALSNEIASLGPL